MNEKISPTQLTKDLLKPFFDKNGFTYKKSWDSFLKKEKWGYKRMGFRTLNYRTSYQFEFSFAIRHDAVENLNAMVFQRYSGGQLPPIMDTIAWSYPSSTGTYVNSSPMMNLFKDEYLEVRNEDFTETANFLQSYIDSTGGEFFNQFEDLRNIDALVNGEDFWLTDWKKPYVLGDEFSWKRIIIAHLCQNQRLKEILNFDYGAWYLKNNPGAEPLKASEPNRIDGLTSQEYLLELLKDVKPLY